MAAGTVLQQRLLQPQPKLPGDVSHLQGTSGLLATGELGMQAPPGRPVGRGAPTSWVIAPRLGQFPSCHSPLLGVGSSPHISGLRVGIPQKGGNSSLTCIPLPGRGCATSRKSLSRGVSLKHFYIFICDSLSAAPTAPKGTEAHTGLCCSSETRARAHPASSFPSLTQLCFLLLFKTDKLLRK